MGQVASSDLPGQPGPRVASSAFAQESEDRRAKRSRQEAPCDDDTEMSELVKYGFNDHKTTATARVHTMRREGGMSADIDDDRRNGSMTGST